jgi:hypothetical protein
VFHTVGRAATAQLRQQDEIDSIVGKIVEHGYRPLLRTAIQSTSECADVPLSMGSFWEVFASRSYRTSPLNIIGDILFLKDHVYLLQPIRRHILAWELRHHQHPSQLDSFCEHVTQAARSSLDGRRLRGMNFEWRKISPPPPRPGVSRRLHENVPTVLAQPATFSTADLERSLLLLDREQREFLIRLGQVGKARSSDARADSKQANTAKLMETRLVRKEFLVLCRQDSHTICSIPDKSELNEHGTDFKCSLCGRAFKDEQIQDIYALTDDGKSLVAGSHWMTIWVTKLLIDAGVPQDGITWNGAAGEDEIDIIADVNGHKLFLELKDREFGLGDAYPFTFRVARYGADSGIVISTAQIGDEAKNFLHNPPREMGGSPIQTIAGHENVADRLSSLIQSISRSATNNTLARVMEPTGLNVIPFVDAWMAAHSV